MKNYRQCNLKNGNNNTVGWIEDRGAVVGKFVEIPSLGNDLWEVTAVGSASVSQKDLTEKQRMDRGALLSIK